RDSLAAEVERCYRAFVSALLDVTDNLVGGAVVRPAELVVYDEEPDAYLVVAADKGTATFSDIANEIAVGRGFWLGDAFASGGSTGYDHKAMGITARGAWESVRRHFRELGVDADTAAITVAGIGDMSGDVFGNGLLRSPHLKLVAAFDHRHVFVDPDPDPQAAFEERRRLFSLPRSSWADYDPSVLSAGGGVWPRTAKSITLSDEARRALGISTAMLTPPELVRAILLAPVDLLWNGGIGTYVKAHDESNLEVGDKSNDAVRVDGRDLRCKVVAEGGNLGFTERGRVEYALAGGRCNTDAIDNSAGVDCSDHEVNLKILLGGPVASGALTVGDRNDLLAAMTEEVAAHVLRHNYEQNQTLGNARHLAADLADVHARFLHALERAGRIDRAVEFLPDDAVIAERTARGLGLTSPELCVLLAYAKITVGHEIRDSHLVDSPYVAPFLHAYFPAPVRERFADAIERHSLRREILATVLANTTVNRGGISFVFRMTEETGASTADVVAAHLVARDVFDVPGFWAGVEALDGVVDVGLQTDLLLTARLLVERGARWLLRHRDLPLDPVATAEELREGVGTVAELLPDLLVGDDRDHYERTIHDLGSAGVERRVAVAAASFPPMGAALDIVEVARTSGRSIPDAAAVYLALGERLQLDRLRDRIAALPRDDRWQTGARSALRDELADERRELTADILATAAGADPVLRLDAWFGQNPAALARYKEVNGEIEAAAEFDLTTLSVAVRELRELRTREESNGRG
ncbi:MAG TPA: NAD-glutamate dehydrogenase domain-containing protein, partial [Acidimicrobiia bacterium]|nr:NAD-glutamate dehydrogenase domain-containing protein [Acidimicrobiia bacterium]